MPLVKAGRREIWTSKSFDVSCDVNSRKTKCMLLIDDLTVLKRGVKTAIIYFTCLVIPSFHCNYLMHVVSEGFE